MGVWNGCSGMQIVVGIKMVEVYKSKAKRLELTEIFCFFFFWGKNIFELLQSVDED